MRLLAKGLVLIGLGLVGLWVILGLTSPRGPLLDMSKRLAWEGAGPHDKRLRCAVATMVSPQETFVAYRRMVELIGHQVGMEGVLILRPTYREVREAIEHGTVDVAFVCTGTYLYGRDSGQMELLAQPELSNDASYQSLLIVPSGSSAQSLSDLQGRAMAFTDPESNTGCLVPSVVLMNLGFEPKTYFAKIVFTGSHDRSVHAVAAGLVDAAAVDSLVFRAMKARDLSLGEKVRIVWASEPFGPPPIVVPKGLDESFKASLKSAVLGLHMTPEGRKLLAEIGIERFVLPRQEDYESAYQLFRTLRMRR